MKVTLDAENIKKISALDADTLFWLSFYTKDDSVIQLNINREVALQIVEEINRTIKVSDLIKELSETN